MDAMAIFEAGSKAIELLQNAIELVSKYHSQKEKIFNNYIEPGFKELQPVIEAYITNITLFRRSASAARNWNDLDIAFRNFEEGRVTVVVNRQKTLGPLLASTSSLLAYMEKRPRRKREALALLEFFEAVSQFFRSTEFAENSPEPPTKSRGSVAGSIIYHAERVLGEERKGGPNNAKKALKGLCDRALNLWRPGFPSCTKPSLR